MIQKFRDNNGSIIDAAQLDYTVYSRNKIAKWCSGIVDEHHSGISIPTPNGIMYAQVGDYVLKSEDNEISILKVEVFIKNYEPINMTGMELIAKERAEQIEKHGHTLENDERYTKGELVQASDFCVKQDAKLWPHGWGDEQKKKIMDKSRVDQLICAGAFLLAEQDRTGEDLWEGHIQGIAAMIDRLNAQE
jgi:hypothetical protein